MGAVAILLPVVIHFLTKPRPTAMPLSTIRFVQAAVKQRRARSWLRDVLVLAMRSLAIGCIAWAFAQPLFNSEKVAEVDTSATTHRVVILDSSQSMSAIESGVDGFQAARVQASRFLKTASGLKANLILAGATPEAVFESPSANVNVLNEALSKSVSQPERIDTQAAINSAAQMLASDQPDLARELIIVSDFQRTNWSTVDFGPLPESTQIKLESTAPTETPQNLAILSVGFAEKPTAGNLGILEVVVGNFSKKANNVRVEVSLNDSVFVLEEICPPNVRTILSKEVMVRESGWQTGWAKILDNQDALVADDQYPFVVQAIETPTCTLVTRQSPSMKPSSSYFLERALSPNDQPVAGQMTVTRMGPGRFALDAVAGSQLLIFDHPGKLQSTQIAAIASLIRRGRGVLYVASEPVDATNLKLLYDGLGSDLRAPVEFSPAPRGASRRELTIASVKQKVRPFNVFGDSLTATLSDLRIAGGLATRRVPDSLDDDILATLSDQSVMLFSSPAGLGNFCVLNVDLNESNLPRHPTFVPIISELVEGLLRSNGRSQESFCGESLTRLLPPSVTGASGLEVIADSESDAASFGEFQQSGEGVVWNWRRLDGPNVFTIEESSNGSNDAGGSNNTESKQVVFALASSIPPEESDLRTLDAEVMTERLSGGRQVSFTRVAEAEKEDNKSWIWFAVAAVVALVGEVLILKWFKT